MMTIPEAQYTIHRFRQKVSQRNEFRTPHAYDGPTMEQSSAPLALPPGPSCLHALGRRDVITLRTCA